MAAILPRSDEPEQFPRSLSRSLTPVSSARAHHGPASLSSLWRGDSRRRQMVRHSSTLARARQFASSPATSRGLLFFLVINVFIMAILIMNARITIDRLRMQNHELQTRIAEQAAVLGNVTSTLGGLTATLGDLADPGTEQKMTALVAQQHEQSREYMIAHLQSDLGQRNADLTQRTSDLARTATELSNKTTAVLAQGAQVAALQTRIDSLQADLVSEQAAHAAVEKERSQLVARIDDVAREDKELRRVIGVDDLHAFTPDTSSGAGGMGGGPPAGAGTWQLLTQAVAVRQASTADLLHRLQGMLQGLDSDEQIFLRQEWLRGHGIDSNRTDIWPVFGPLTQGFGPTWLGIEPPMDWNREHFDHFHTGIDLSVNYGTPVHATADGVVFMAGKDASGSNSVVIEHAGGYESVFYHNWKLLVQPGDHIRKGQTIALSGNTGNSTGPHVHYELRHNGQIIDPYPLITGK